MWRPVLCVMLLCLCKCLHMSRVVRSTRGNVLFFTCVCAREPESLRA